MIELNTCKKEKGERETKKERDFINNLKFTILKFYLDRLKRIVDNWVFFLTKWDNFIKKKYK